MRLVVQRVSRARVAVEGVVAGEIGKGLLVLVGVGRGEGSSAAARAAEKTWHLRIFGPSPARSAADLGLPVLAVSQFTLHADVSRGRRPGYSAAAPPDEAEPAYEAYCQELAKLGAHVERGVFGAYMDVESVNDGPVTIVIEV